MAIAFINSTALTIGTAASTWSIPTHSSRAGGAAFIVGLGPASSAVTVSTVTDNTTNVYRLAVRQGTPKPAASAELWYVSAISSASTRVSVTLSGNSSGSLAVGQWSGVSTGNPVHMTGSTAITANSTVHRAAEITPTSNGTLIVAFHRANVSTISPTAVDNSFSQWVTTGGAVRTMGLYAIQGTASTASGQWRTNAAGTSGGCQHSGVIASFSDTADAVVAGGGYVDAFNLMGVL